LTSQGVSSAKINVPYQSLFIIDSNHRDMDCLDVDTTLEETLIFSETKYCARI